MIDIKKLEPNMTVYSVERQRCGNIKNMTREAIFEVVVTEVNLGEGWVMARWNHNEARKYHARGGKFKWRKEKPKREPA